MPYVSICQAPVSTRLLMEECPSPVQSPIKQLARCWMRFQVFLNSLPGSCFPCRAQQGLLFDKLTEMGMLPVRCEWSNHAAPEFLSLLPLFSWSSGLLGRERFIDVAIS